MSERPLVTVVVFCYDHGSYLRDCLDGIVGQHIDFPMEVIVIDDASADSSPEIIREYASRYPEIVKPYLLKENSFSRGRSHYKDIVIPRLRETGSKYVAFCEGDDYWIYPNKLTRQVDFLETHPDYSGCFHHYLVKNEIDFSERQMIFNLRHSRRVSLFDLLIEPQQQSATILMRSDILLHDKELYNYFGTSNFIDVVLFLAIYNAGKAYCFREWWSVYRKHSNGISQNISAEDAENRHLAILRQFGTMYGGKYDGLDIERRRHIAMRDSLAEATSLRRKREYLGYIRAMIGAFVSSPLQFIKEYYKQWQ